MVDKWTPPPTWPLPEGFQPPPGWQPDPRWETPPDWNFYPKVDTKSSAVIRGRAAVVVAGAALAVIGSLITWISIEDNFGGTLSRTGVDWDSGAATVIIIVAVAAALTQVAQVAGWSLPWLLSYGPVIAGGVILWNVISAGHQVVQRQHLAQRQASGISVHIGAGIWLAGAGGAAMILAVVYDWWNRSRHEPGAPPASSYLPHNWAKRLIGDENPNIRPINKDAQ